MLNGKAAAIIKTFSKSERNSFADFLRSPYFNSNKNLAKLYSHIQKYFHRINDEKINEEFLYCKLFPGRKYNYKIMKNLLSSLAALSEKFIIVNHSSKYINTAILLMKEYDKRGLDIYFHKTHKKLSLNTGDKQMYKEYYRDYSDVQETMREFYRNRSDVKKYSEYLLSGIDYTFPFIVSLLSDEFMLLVTAEHNTNLKPETDILREFISSLKLDDFINYISRSNLKNKEDMLIKLKTIKLFTDTENNDMMYYELRDSVFNNSHLYSNSMLDSLINNNILSYAEKRTSEGNREFLAERYNVMKKLFSLVKMNSEGVGYIFLSTYLDVVLTGIKLGETEYAFEFAEKFRNDVEPAAQNAAYHLAVAYIFAAKEDYESCLAELAIAEQTDHHIKLRTRFLYLKCYFELKMFEQGLSSVDSFNKYITDTKELHPDFRKILLDSCKSYKELFKITASPERYTADKLDKQIDFVRKSKISSKEWHISKLTELRKFVK